MSTRATRQKAPVVGEAGKPAARYRAALFGASEVRVLIPKDHARGGYRARVERAVRWLWSRGIYPGPSAVSLRLHGYATRTLNGRETWVRNEMMVKLGIRRQRKYPIDPARFEELAR